MILVSSTESTTAISIRIKKSILYGCMRFSRFNGQEGFFLVQI